MLHVSQESRDEVQRFYRKRFTEGDSLALHGYIWFNDDIDVLLFGKNTCTHIMNELFSDQGGFRKVGLFIDLPRGGNDCRKGDAIMKALHGSAVSEGIPGCQGLENVSLVAPSNVWDIPHNYPQVVSLRFSEKHSIQEQRY